MHFMTPIPGPTAGIYAVRIRCDGQSTFTGDRKGSLAFGACGLVLAEGVDPADFVDAAFRCVCGAWATTTGPGAEGLAGNVGRVARRAFLLENR
jgi:hypothetical protein